MMLAIQSLIADLSETSVYAIAAAVAVFVGFGAGIGMAIGALSAV